MTTASGTLTYTVPLAPAEAVAIGGSLAPTSLGSRSIYRTTTHPETGRKIEGWRWGERVWPDDRSENLLGNILPLFDATTSGLLDEWFESGVLGENDLEVLEIQEVATSGILSSANLPVEQWWPVVKPGYFYEQNEESYLFSDDSLTIVPTYSGLVSGLSPGQIFSRVELPEQPKIGTPIRAQRFVWDSTLGKYTPTVTWATRPYFTGTVDDEGVVRDTVSGDAILYQNIDTTGLEAVLVWSGTTLSGVTPALLFSNRCVEPIGVVTASGVPDPETLDQLGYFRDSESPLRLNYGPVDTTCPAHIYSWSQTGEGGIGPCTRWICVSSGESLGIHEVFLDPVGGNVTFDSAHHPTEGDCLGAYYYVSTRVEYEPSHALDRATGLLGDLNPLRKQTGSAFVLVTPRDTSPVTLTLEADLPELSSDYYGPLSIGTNYTSLIATATDILGLPVEGVSVTFSQTGDLVVGSFGSDETITAVTGSDGKARVFYSPPGEVSGVGQVVTSGAITTVGSTTTLRTSQLPLIPSDLDDPTDIYLYAIYADDPILGLRYDGVSWSDVEGQVRHYYEAYFAEHGIYGPTGMVSSGVLTATGQDWEETYRILHDLVTPTIYGNGGSGRHKIVAEYDTEALNPHNPTVSGAWVPKQPETVTRIDETTYDLAYDTSSVSIPQPGGYLVGYLVVSPVGVGFEATCYVTSTGVTLTSNPISIRLVIPSYMSGLWVIDGVNDLNINELSSLIVAAMEGRKLPLGFRLRSQSITLAAALDGVTFLDINATDNTETMPSTWPHLGHSLTVSIS